MISLSKRKFTKYYDHLMVYIVIGLSGAIHLPNKDLLVIAAVCIFAATYVLRNSSIDKTLIYIMVIILTLFAMQTVKYGRFEITNVVRFLINFILPYIVVKQTRESYTPAYVNVIYFLSIISLLLYVPSVLFDDFHRLMGKIAPALGTDISLGKIRGGQNFLIYTWEPKTSNSILNLRNSGAFVEPGMFSVFLVYAIYYNSFSKRKKSVIVKNFVFVIALLTTFSTAGYLTLFTMALMYTMRQKLGSKIFIVPLIIITASLSVSEMDFLGKKLTAQIYRLNTGEYYKMSRGRFVSAIIDFQDIKEHPLTGRGISIDTRFDEIGEDLVYKILNHRTNGITDALVRLGVIGFSLMIIILYQSAATFNGRKDGRATNPVIFMTLTFMLLFSQPMFFSPFILSLLYVRR